MISILEDIEHVNFGDILSGRDSNEKYIEKYIE